jgi:hypothetical protein
VASTAATSTSRPRGPTSNQSVALLSQRRVRSSVAAQE